MSTTTERHLRVALFAVLLVVTVLHTVEALTFNMLTMYAPLVAGTLASMVLTIALVREVVRMRAAGRRDATAPAGGIEATDEVLTATTLRVGIPAVGAIPLFFWLLRRFVGLQWPDGIVW